MNKKLLACVELVCEQMGHICILIFIYFMSILFFCSIHI